MKKIIALALALVMVFALCACGSTATTATETETKTETATEAKTETKTEEKVEETVAEAAPDTITVMVPPVSDGYADMLKEWAAAWTAEHPNITIEVIETSWDDHNSKLSTMALAGEAPDIAEVSYSSIGTYVEMGVSVDITDYIDVSDYDDNALAYMSLEDTLYGLPLYVTIQSLGGNKAMLEAAGVDVEDVQKNGWTYDEFLTAIENGTKDGTWGFVFANAGVTTSDFINIFGGVAGLTNAFTSDLKYAFTSDNMLTLLTAIEEIISSGYMPNYTVAAGERLVMLGQGKTMITGKAMPLFENNIRNWTNAVKDGTAEEGYIEVEYAFLPLPTMDGVTESCFGSVDGMMAFLNSNSTEEHLKNVCEFLDYICSGDRVAAVDNTLLLPCVCQTGRDAQASADPIQDENNNAAAARCISLVVAPPAGITVEQSANASTIMNEVIVPKLEALIAGEATAQEVYDAICTAAVELFGADGCETGHIG